MSRAERIVFALRPFREAGKSAALSQRPDAAASPGQDFVRIGLMPDVPDQAVLRRVEHIMKGDGELDHPETGPEMAARDCHRIDRLLAQLVGELA